MIDITDPKALPANPSITHLKKQAKALKKAFLAGDPGALSRVSVSHPDQGSVGLFALRDAQVTIAREYGFAGWHQLSTTVGERMVEERDLHRWFGVHLNNGMWGRIDDPGFGPDSPMKEREDALMQRTHRLITGGMWAMKPIGRGESISFLELRRRLASTR